MQELFDLDAAELYKTVVVELSGKPVATGSLNITIAPIQTNPAKNMEVECCEQDLLLI